MTGPTKKNNINKLLRHPSMFHRNRKHMKNKKNVLEDNNNICLDNNIGLDNNIDNELDESNGSSSVELCSDSLDKNNSLEINSTINNSEIIKHRKAKPYKPLKIIEKRNFSSNRQIHSYDDIITLPKSRYSTNLKDKFSNFNDGNRLSEMMNPQIQRRNYFLSLFCFQ